MAGGTLVLPLTSCVTPSELLNCSVSQFPHLENVMVEPTSEAWPVHSSRPGCEAHRGVPACSRRLLPVDRPACVWGFFLPGSFRPSGVLGASDPLPGPCTLIPAQPPGQLFQAALGSWDPPHLSRQGHLDSACLPALTWSSGLLAILCRAPSLFWAAPSRQARVFLSTAWHGLSAGL